MDIIGRWFTDDLHRNIDPGKDGAIAMIVEPWDDNKQLVVTNPFGRDEYKVILKNAADKSACCCLERVGAMPGQGVTSMFKFGENFGFIQGLLTAYSIPYELVTPQKWKKEFQITGDKNSSIAVCKRLFPDVSLRRTDRCKKDHDGMAEALLLACYAKRKM